MAVTKMSNVVNPEVMGTMIEAKIDALAKITPYAKVDTTLQGVAGDTKTVPSWNYIGDAEDVAEGGEVGVTSLTASTTTFTIKKAMKSVGLTQEAVNSGLGNPIGQTETQLAKSIVGKVDNDLIAASMTSSKTFNPSTAVVISYDAIVDIVDVFDEEDITDKAMFVNPKQVTKLRKDTNFISADKYNNNVMITGEIGMVAGVRIVPSKKAPLIKYAPCASGDTGAKKVVASGATSTQVNAGDINGHVWDATNKVVKADYTGTEETAVYVAAVANEYYLNPVLKLEPASPETELTEDELPALTIFLKKDTQVDAEWLPKKQQHDITAAKYYGVALTNAAKVVVAQLKA